MNISFQIIGHNIKATRTALGLTEEEAAERAGISPLDFAQIERGTQKTSSKLLAQIADALNTSIHTLLHGCILDKENHPAIFESPDSQTQEYGEYALLILNERLEQIRQFYEQLDPSDRILH